MVLLGGAVVLFATPSPPARDCLEVFEAGTAGGPIDVLVPPILGRGGLDIVIEGGLVDVGRLVDGVVPQGVEAVEVAAESCFVGDLVGD